MELSIHVSELKPGVRTLRAAGPIYNDSARGWEQQVQRELNAKPAALLINLSKVTYITSWGMGVLIACSGTQEQARGTRIVLVGAQGETRESLRLMGLFELYADAPDEESALKLLERGA